MESVAVDAALLSLLRSARLPTADVRPEAAIAFFGAKADGELLGVVALERCGSHGLLRSLAVSEARRGSGVGRALRRRKPSRVRASLPRSVRTVRY